jgi:putative FmdB family regulatory protein
MPIFEYKCQKCGTVFEKIILSKNNQEEVNCSKCSSNMVQKVISAASLRLSTNTAGSIPMGAHAGCSSPSGFS